MTKKMGCLVVFVAVAIFGKVLQPKLSSRSESTEPAPLFDEVARWPVGQTIALRDSVVSDSVLVSLAGPVRGIRPDAKVLFVEVYTTKKAANLRDDALSERLPAELMKYWESRRVAAYTRNKNTGVEEYTYWRNGTGTGKGVSVPFK